MFVHTQRTHLALASLVALAFAAAPSNATLVAHFEFENDLTDSSGSGNHGASSGAAITFESGIVGQAARLSDAWVTVPHSASLNLSTGMTLSAFINTSGPQLGGNPNSGIIFKGDLNNTQGAYDLAIIDNAEPSDAAAYINDASVQARQDEVVSYDIWHHLAATYDGTSLDLYLDGALIESTPFIGTINQEVSPLAIGNRFTTGPSRNQFFGLIDDVRIYDEALTPSQIQQLASIPEPSTAVLLGLGMTLLAARTKRSAKLG